MVEPEYAAENSDSSVGASFRTGMSGRMEDGDNGRPEQGNDYR